MSLNKQHNQQSQTSNVQWGVKQLNVIHLFTFITFRYLDKVTVSAASVKGILGDLVQSLFAARMPSQNICAAVIYCLVYIVTFKFYYRLNLATSLLKLRLPFMLELSSTTFFQFPHLCVSCVDFLYIYTYIQRDSCEHVAQKLI